jgi:GNAT superfamily N-acetyltransferase
LSCHNIDFAEVTVREYKPEDAEDLLKVRNAIFPPLTIEQWLSTSKTFTAALAYVADEPVGAIPFDMRNFLVAPGKVITVAQENAVGVREDMRSRGIGTRMIEAAAEFLRDRCDVLTVYRGAERSRGYKFYERSGHDDLLFLRQAIWREPCGQVSDTAVFPVESADTEGSELLRVFEDRYGTMGGFPPRSSHYWKIQLHSQIYVVLPTDLAYLRYPASGRLEAYALIGQRLETSPEQTYPMAILEFAATSRHAARSLLRGLGAFASQRKRPVSAYVCWDYPFRDVLAEVGFEEEIRSFMIMGRVINPSRLLQRVVADLSALDELVVDVWTPRTEYRLHEGPAASKRVTLEGKNWVISRLLTRRLDVRSAVAHDLLTIRGGDDEVVDRLAHALPYCQWVYHHIDYI